MKTNIVLIGMRGSGKTTIAHILAVRLGKTYIELDALLAEKEGIPISEVVSKKGWDYFREKESACVRGISDVENAVVSTGGGVVLNDENMTVLKRNGVCVFLYASIEKLVVRAGKDPARPLLTGAATFEEDLRETWKVREQKYRSASDVTIDTTDLSTEETVTQIIAEIAKIVHI